MNYLKSLTSLLILLAFIVALSACGEKPPVSIKDGDPISQIEKSTIDIWVAAGNKDVERQCAERKGTTVDNSRCLSQGKELVKQQVLSGLIGDAWVVDEAKSRGIKISASEEKDIEKAAANSSTKANKGFPRENLLARARAEFLLTKMAAERIKTGKISLNNKQIKEQYKLNKKAFSQPEKRDVIFVTTQNQKAAEVIASRMRKGEDATKVLQDLGAPKNKSPELKGVVKKDVPKQARFIFDLPKGKVYGPKNIQGAWVVAKVTKITPAKQLGISEARPIIKRQGQQQLATQQLKQEIQDIWRPRTTCADGYDSPLCSNRQAQLGQ